MADLNNFNSGNIIQPANQPKIIIDKESIGRTLKNIAAPVFDFFTKEPEKQDPMNTNFEEEIKKYEMRTAVTQKILNDSDPTARTQLNIVF